MGHVYRAVGWNRQKRLYDTVLVAAVGGYLVVFAALTLALRPQATLETVLIRAFGTCALLLLHVILSIGPLARLSPRFLPLLYNRRHLGVTMFLLALTHGTLALVQFHALGAVNPLVSLLAGNGRYDSLAWFPFQPLGAAALTILFLMAATSHDFWLRQLTAPVWKTLHMLVYVAYGLLVGHVALGVLQVERQPLFAFLLAAGLVWIVGVHLVAGRRETRRDARAAPPAPEAPWVEACDLADLSTERGHVVTVGGERVALFLYDGKISALSNVCQHQNGPLGEGCVLDGLVTCPWHGYQYDPASGASPPPFEERVPTFRVRLAGDRVLVDPRPHPPGSAVEPVRIESPDSETTGTPFYVGYRPQSPPPLARFTRRVVVSIAAAALAVATLLAGLQRRFDPGVFEFLEVRRLAGVVREHPYPALRLSATAGDVSDLQLVLPGKRGAAELVAGLEGRRVELSGKLIYRSGRTLVEAVPGSVRELGAGDPGMDGAPVRLGVFELAGEIVDGKCYLGVMKPGREKTHRACAALCIRGGIPPLLAVPAPPGDAAVLLLADGAGGAIGDRLLDLVGEPVTVTGRVELRGGALLLLADPAAYRRLGATEAGS